MSRTDHCIHSCQRIGYCAGMVSRETELWELGISGARFRCAIIGRHNWVGVYYLTNNKYFMIQSNVLYSVLQRLQLPATDIK